MTRGKGRKLTPEQRERATESLAKARDVRRAKQEEATMEQPPITTNPNEPWTWERVRAMVASGEMSTVKFVPDETIPIGWNNLTVQVTKGVEIEVPEPFYGVYKESRKATIDAFTEAQATLDRRAPQGQSTHGVGWVPGGTNE